jgi:hypothetical protein
MRGVRVSVGTVSTNNTPRDACMHNRIGGSALRRTGWHAPVNR